MSKLHELRIIVAFGDGTRCELRVDTSQRRRPWWHCYVDRLVPGSTVRVTTNDGEGVKLVDCRKAGAS